MINIEKILAIILILYIAYLYFYKSIPFEFSPLIHISAILATIIGLFYMKYIAILHLIALCYTYYLSKCHNNSNNENIDKDLSILCPIRETNDSPIGKAFNY